MRSYRQLTQQERYQIAAYSAAGHSQKAIAEMLERSPATISRELRRNRSSTAYDAHKAHKIALSRRPTKSRTRYGWEVWREVEGFLQQEWSPEQICGRLKAEGNCSPSHEWIYRYVYADKRHGGTLHLHLRCQKQRRKRYGSNDRRGQIAGRVSIEQRPSAVENRGRIGDWEGDTIVGAKQKGALLSLVERRSRLTRLVPLKGKNALATTRAIVQSLKNEAQRALTMTLDNGSEFAGHSTLTKELGTRVYFAHPYASHERGTNENTNGLVRQYLPKGMRLDQVSQRLVVAIEDRLNNRPRKCLGYCTPNEVYYDEIRQPPVALTS